MRTRLIPPGTERILTPQELEECAELDQLAQELTEMKEQGTK